MKKLNRKIILVFALLSLSGNALAGACDASSPEEIAKYYGVEASKVKEEVTYERRTTSECLWAFLDAEGYGVSITYRTFDKTDKITNPDFFKNNQQYLIKNGKKVGSWDVKYSSADFPNTEYGAISNVYGSRYTKMMHYVWVKAEQRRLGVTYSYTVNEKGEMKQPTKEDIQKAVAIFTD